MLKLAAVRDTGYSSASTLAKHIDSLAELMDDPSYAMGKRES